MQLLQRVAEVEEQQRLMQAQLADFIAKQQEENAWVRAQIGQIFSFYASDACPTAPTPPTTVPPLAATWNLLGLKHKSTPPHQPGATRRPAKGLRK